jgi:hypothetical protein
LAALAVVAAGVTLGARGGAGLVALLVVPLAIPMLLFGSRPAEPWPNRLTSDVDTRSSEHHLHVRDLRTYCHLEKEEQMCLQLASFFWRGRDQPLAINTDESPLNLGRPNTCGTLRNIHNNFLLLWPQNPESHKCSH